MNKLAASFLCLLLLVVPGAIGAAAFDGSQPLLCAVAEAFECQAGLECQRRSAAQVNLPDFLRIDVKKKTIVSTEASGKQDATKISGVSRADGMLLLHGADAYHGFSIAIGETGKMSLSLSAHHVGFVAFGACTSAK